ncbi:MAG: hypothetical protein PHT07_15325 [Paludibacter sp.]|nr:hypothetical protein [Paludibacter sp.]
MDRIATFLSSYNMDLSDCHPDWIDIVEEYNGIKSALPEEVREIKENAIIAEFKNFHSVEVEEPEKKPIVPVKKKSADKNKQKPQYSPHNIDEKSLLDKADNIIADLL